jgi:hypothetical protein
LKTGEEKREMGMKSREWTCSMYTVHMYGITTVKSPHITNGCSFN